MNSTPKTIFEAALLDKSTASLKHEKRFHPKPASVAVTCHPGTKAKLEALARRAEMGEELWHPQDAVVNRDHNSSESPDSVELLEYLKEIIAKRCNAGRHKRLKSAG